MSVGVTESEWSRKVVGALGWSVFALCSTILDRGTGRITFPVDKFKSSVVSNGCDYETVGTYETNGMEYEIRKMKQNR